MRGSNLDASSINRKIKKKIVNRREGINWTNKNRWRNGPGTCKDCHQEFLQETLTAAFQWTDLYMP